MTARSFSSLVFSCARVLIRILARDNCVTDDTVRDTGEGADERELEIAPLSEFQPPPPCPRLWPGLHVKFVFHGAKEQVPTRWGTYRHPLVPWGSFPSSLLLSSTPLWPPPFPKNKTTRGYCSGASRLAVGGWEPTQYLLLSQLQHGLSKVNTGQR